MFRKRILSILIMIFFISNIPISVGFIQPQLESFETQENYIDYSFEWWREQILQQNGFNLESLEDLPDGLLRSINEQARIYEGWARGIYTAEEKNILLIKLFNTPYISYYSFGNIPQENQDLRSFNDEKFDITFRLIDNEVNEWVERVYAFLDYNIDDTERSNSNKFEDNSDMKDFGPGEIPTPSELNPDTNFMGLDFNQILYSEQTWTRSQRSYRAIKNNPGRIDPEIYFHVKVLYRIQIFEQDGWHSYFYYQNFALDRYRSKTGQVLSLRIIDDDIKPPQISEIEILNAPITEEDTNIEFKLTVDDQSGISSLFINFDDTNYYADTRNIITIPTPIKPGTYNYDIIAVDNDNDRENDQLTTTLSRSFSISDDDNNPPIFNSIDILNLPILDNEESITFNIDVQDNSGIAELFIEFNGTEYYDDDEDFQITIPNPITPGEYDYTIIAIDNDQDQIGDQLNSSYSSFFYVYDDDNVAPYIFGIDLLNSPIYDDEDFITFDIKVQDDSGLDRLYIEFQGETYEASGNLITIPNPQIPDIYTFMVVALDGDKDRKNDQLNSSVESTFNVYDDDNKKPQIFGVNIINSPIYDNMDVILIEINASDKSGLAELQIDFEGIFYNANELNIVELPNPVVPDIYNITIIAIDNDTDSPGDQKINTFNTTFEVLDDDKISPQINLIDIINEPINDQDDLIEIELNALDESGISELYIIFDAKIYHTDQENKVFLPNPKTPGIYTFQIIAVDADNEWVGDASTTIIDYYIEVMDDDTSPPDISNFEIINAPIYDSSPNIIFDINVSDESGISKLYILFEGNRYDANENNQIELPNPINPGFYEFELVAVDGDLDREGDQLNISLNSSFEVQDDDTSPPEILEINVLDAPIYDEEDWIIFEISSEDDSGIDEVFIEFQGSKYYINPNNQISVANPKIPGVYECFFTLIDADQDREDDQLSFTRDYSFEVFDDDSTAPKILDVQILNEPLLDSDGNVMVEIQVEDESGLSALYVEFMNNRYDATKNNLITFPNPKEPNLYKFKITAIDDDNDRDNDQLLSYQSLSFEVKDDDLEAPEVKDLIIVNSPIYDCNKNIVFEASIYDASGLSEVYINFLGNKYNMDLNNQIIIPSPILPNNYEYTLVAIDADDDRPKDQLQTSISSKFTIFDDDPTPPEIIISESGFGWNIMIQDKDGAEDSSATGEFIVLNAFGDIIDSGKIDGEDLLYEISIPFKPGIYQLIVNASNNDNEWEGDIEENSLVINKEITFEHCFLFLDREIEDLKEYVDNNLYKLISICIRFKLSLTQNYLRRAYQLLLDNYSTCVLFKELVAQALICITRFETTFFSRIDCIQPDDSEFIISKLREIRNFIVLLMGNTVDYIKNTTIGYEIASIEVNQLNLKDYVDAEIGCTGRYLNILIKLSVIQLEITFFELSMDLNISSTLTHAQCIINMAIDEVLDLFKAEKITEEQRDYIIGELNQAIIDIGLVNSKI